MWAPVSAAGRYLQRMGAVRELSPTLFYYLHAPQPSPSSRKLQGKVPSGCFLRDSHHRPSPRVPRWCAAHHTGSVYVCGALVQVATKCAPALMMAQQAKRVDNVATTKVLRRERHG